MLKYLATTVPPVPVICSYESKSPGDAEALYLIGGQMLAHSKVIVQTNENSLNILLFVVRVSATKAAACSSVRQRGGTIAQPDVIVFDEG